MVLLRICGALLKTSLEWPWNLMVALKKLRRPIVIQCHTDGPLLADKIARFCDYFR
jgi:hypothetical protein